VLPINCIFPWRGDTKHLDETQGEEYYKGLGYKSLMDGVVGEAEKNGRGEEVKARIADFKKKSQMKAFSVISVALTALVYSKVTFDMDPANHIGNLPM